MVYSVAKALRAMPRHTADEHNFSVIAALQAWGGSVLSSGSRDRCILHRDIRCAEHYTAKLSGHRSEVCGLKVRGRRGV